MRVAGCSSVLTGAHPHCPTYGDSSPRPCGDFMTMPTDASDAVPSEGSNDGPREHTPETDAVEGAHVDDENVPHPPENGNVQN